MPVLAPKPAPPRGETAFALLERNIPEPVKLCDPWAMEGLNIIAGRPKLGKTTLERQKMAAAATGSAFLDSQFPTACKCVFLSLEEGELLTRMKFKAAGFAEQALTNIEIFFSWQRGAIGVTLLDDYLTANPDVRLVVIDSLTKFRAQPDARSQQFMEDYNAVSQLQDMVKRHPGVCIDLIHHTRKVKSDDPIDDVSGTYGLTAACDLVCVMRHHGQGAVLYVAGRLWSRDETEFSMVRGAGHTWTMIGPHLDMTDKQREALEMLKARAGGMSGAELADELHITTPSAWQRLDELLEKGFVRKIHGRCYAK